MLFCFCESRLFFEVDDREEELDVWFFFKEMNIKGLAFSFFEAFWLIGLFFAVLKFCCWRDNDLIAVYGKVEGDFFDVCIF